MSIGATIRRIRRSKDLSQDQLAEKSGLSRPTISNLENDPEANPEKETLEKLAGALDVTLEDLTGDSIPSAYKPENQEADKHPVLDESDVVKAATDFIQYYRYAWRTAGPIEKAEIEKSFKTAFKGERGEKLLKVIQGED